jgi:hypothetical protein
VVRFLTAPRDVCILYNIQTGSGVRQTSYTVGIGGFFPAGKAAGELSWPLTSIQCRGYGCVEELYLHRSICLRGVYKDRLTAPSRFGDVVTQNSWSWTELTVLNRHRYTACDYSPRSPRFLSALMIVYKHLLLFLYLSLLCWPLYFSFRPPVCFCVQ